MVVLPNLVPLWRTNGGFLVHALGLTRSVDCSSSGVVIVSAAHGGLVHLIAKGEPLGEAAGIKAGIRRRGILVLRSVCRQSSFSIGSQSIVIRQAILWADVLQDLLVNVQFGTGVRKPVIIAGKTMAKVVLIVSHAAVTAVGRPVEPLRIGS